MKCMQNVATSAAARFLSSATNRCFQRQLNSDCCELEPLVKNKWEQRGSLLHGHLSIKGSHTHVWVIYQCFHWQSQERSFSPLKSIVLLCYIVFEKRWLLSSGWFQAQHHNYSSFNSHVFSILYSTFHLRHIFLKIPFKVMCRRKLLKDFKAFN